MSSIQTILTSHNIRAKKSMGQNFLKSKEICDTIVDKLAVQNNDIILEIGSGLGALTFPAAKSVKKLFGIEKDYKLAEILKTQLVASGTTNVEIITGDALKINFNDIHHSANQKLILIGNLPYNISSHMLLKTIQNRNIFNKAVFMLQKEVADRISSTPCSKEYGRLSVKLQYYAKIRTLFKIKPTMFFPEPKIESSLVEISFADRPTFVAKDEKLLSSVIKAAFSKRRKTLKNSLSESLISYDVKQILINAGINPVRRAETLTTKEFVTLSNHCYAARLKYEENP